MTTSPTPPGAHLINSLRQLQALRHSNEPLRNYWKPLLDALLTIADADSGLIAIQAAKESAQWKPVVSGPEPDSLKKFGDDIPAVIAAAALECATNGFAAFGSDNGSILALNLVVDADTQKCIALFYLPTKNQSTLRQSKDALLSVNDLPALHRMQQAALDALKTQNRLTDILDIMVTLNSQKNFLAAAMTVCNEIASRYKCERVSLGWMKNRYIRLVAMSHTDHFEKKMESVRKLEIAMEEAMDQDTEISYPAEETSALITRDHEIYATSQDVKYILTLPLRDNEDVVALLSLERNSTPFTGTDVRQLRVSADQFSTRLIELKRKDRWIGARIADSIRDGMGKFLGYEHTWAKIISIAAFLTLAIISTIPVRYRVSSPMILKTDDISYLTAPFDSYIDAVGCKPGDIIEKDSVLLSLDNRDLLLEQAALLAEKNKYEHEIEKTRAVQELADMCIAQAQLDQVIAKLQINRFKLEQANILSPFTGIIIEGDLKEKRGSPVTQGEILFKIGRIKDIFVEAKVHESEIQNIMLQAGGQIALSSRPQDLHTISVTLIEPSAVVSENDNIFKVRCSIDGTIPQWFRPGMTGISKINAGRRTILWIISHRTIDFLRLKLWW